MANLKLIPTDPYFVPDEAAQDRLIEALDPFVEEAEVSLTVTPQVELVHHGKPPHQIQCPACGAGVQQSWWTRTIRRAYEKNSECADLSARMPCCKAHSSLNELKYTPPAGFARFVLSIDRAPRSLTFGEFRELERRLGQKLRKINARHGVEVAAVHRNGSKPA